MIVTKLEALDAKRIKIYIDNCFAFVLYKGEIRTYKIKVDESISEDTYHTIVSEVLQKRAKLRAMNLLTQRPYTESKLRQKLQEGYYPQETIEVAIDYVKKYGYVDDYRYAMDYLEYHSECQNRQQILQKLKQKGIDGGTLSKVFEDFFSDGGEIREIEQIKRFLQKKHFSQEGMDYEQISKLKASLYRKGFSMDNISKAMEAFT